MNGLVPIDTNLTTADVARFTDPAPLPGQAFYAVVAVDAAGNALNAVQVVQSPSDLPLFADGFESGSLSAWTGSL